MITNAMFHNQTYAVYIRLGLLHVFNTAALFSLPKELDRKSALLGIQAIVNGSPQKQRPFARLGTHGEATNSTAQHSTSSWRPREQRSSFIPTTDAHVSAIVPCPPHRPFSSPSGSFSSRPDQATYETQGLIVPTSLWPNLASLSRRRSSTSTLLEVPSTSR